MTPEEKARAYDEALEKAREIKKKIIYSHLSTESCKAVSEYIDIIIPELRKSEDERIIEELIGHCKDLVRMSKGDKALSSIYEQWLTYLEKQKEQKSVK